MFSLAFVLRKSFYIRISVFITLLSMQFSSNALSWIYFRTKMNCDESTCINFSVHIFFSTVYFIKFVDEKIVLSNNFLSKSMWICGIRFAIITFAECALDDLFPSGCVCSLHCSSPWLMLIMIIDEIYGGFGEEKNVFSFKNARAKPYLYFFCSLRSWLFVCRAVGQNNVHNESLIFFGALVKTSHKLCAAFFPFRHLE